MTVEFRPFGSHDGETVHEARLASPAGVSVSVLSYGCAIRDWRVPLPDGRRVPVVLGFEAFEHYAADRKSFGIIAGRVANRIAGGRFTLDGRTYQLPCNQPPNHLHGGPGGLGKRVWRMEEAGEAAVRLTLHSPDGDQGYPGAVGFEVTIALDGTTLSFDVRAVPDRPTPISLAQHNYYNLSDGPDVLDHVLTVRADRTTPLDATLIPTGEVLPVDGTEFDFRRPRGFRGPDGAPVGYDRNLCLEEGRDRSLPAAELTSPATGLRLRLWTDEPGLQLFNAFEHDIPAPGLDGRRYGPFCGVCLEPQHWPDALNHSHFPSIVRTPEAPYRQTLRVDIAHG